MIIHDTVAIFQSIIFIYCLFYLFYFNFIDKVM